MMFSLSSASCSTTFSKSLRLSASSTRTFHCRHGQRTFRSREMFDGSTSCLVIWWMVLRITEARSALHSFRTASAAYHRAARLSSRCPWWAAVSIAVRLVGCRAVAHEVARMQAHRGNQAHAVSQGNHPVQELECELDVWPW